MTENKKNINRLPVLTPEQRSANLARAVEARRERAAAKLEITEGCRDAAAEVLEPGEVLAAIAGGDSLTQAIEAARGM